MSIFLPFLFIKVANISFKVRPGSALVKKNPVNIYSPATCPSTRDQIIHNPIPSVYKLFMCDHHNPPGKAIPMLILKND